MIKKLQRKFILITAVSVAIVITVLLAGINIANLYQSNKEADSMLNMIADNGGRFPDFIKRGPREYIPPTDSNLEDIGKINNSKPQRTQENPVNKQKNDLFNVPFNEETKFKTRYFTVKADVLGNMNANIDNIAAISMEEAVAYAKKAEQKDKATGYIEEYRYLIKQTNDSKIYVFLDNQDQIRTFRKFMVFSILIGLGCLVLVVLLVTLLSKRAINPIIENMEKQKRFITDAGHEIKTPLAIIQANAEVIEMTAGESEWTASIRNQVVRLNELVKNLLTLAKMEEIETKLNFTPVDFTELVNKASKEFMALMQTKNLELDLKVEEKIIFDADETKLSQLINLIMDNAVKYALENTVIKVSLKKTGKKIEFKVYNACNNLPDGNLEKLFDRFYRVDESRSRKTGGYGIGLSVAKAIVNSHKGKIVALREENGISFVTTFSTKK